MARNKTISTQGANVIRAFGALPEELREPVIAPARTLAEPEPAPSQERPFQQPGPHVFFSGAPFRHALDAASGPRPHPIIPSNPGECFKVREADMSISFAAGAPPIIGIDTEYVQDLEAGDKQNRILSYQFAVITPGASWRGIVYCEDNRCLTLSGLIGHALELGIRNKVLRKWPLHVFVAAHHTNAEMVSFADFARIKTKFDAVRKTFATVKNACPVSHTDTSKHKRPFWVSLIDTQHLTPGGKALVILGDLYKFPKIDLPPGCDKARMDLVLRNHPDEFESYAIRDAEISAYHVYRMREFARDLLGEEAPPLTLASIGVKHLFNLWEKAGIDHHTVLGTKMSKAKRVYVQKRGSYVTLKPHDVLVDDRDTFEGLATKSYHGGRNEAFLFGVTQPGEWTDYDLTGAYTTAMVAIKTPDYQNARISDNPNDYTHDVMGFAWVRFRFPEGTRFPCLPVVSDDDHGLVFPLEGETYVASSEIALARRMGAELEILHGIIVPWADDTRPFEEFVRDTQSRRGDSKGGFEDRLWKEIGNSLYGKTAQGLREKTAFSPRSGRSVKIPNSPITNPYLAAYITSLVRAVLGEILSRVRPNRTVVCATTDGVLTNAPRNELDTSGPLCTLFADMRERLSGNREILEKKHKVARVLCIKTRAQVTFEAIEGEKPLLAKGGIWIAGDEKDPNAFMLRLFRDRKPDTKLPVKMLTSLRELYGENCDLVSHQQDRRINLEPDHKRELINATERNGLLYCETRPWRTVEQFNENRGMFEEWRRSRVLKTLDDWREWERYLAGAEASRRGVRRGPDGVVGQARLLVLKAYTLRAWGFKDGRTYKAFADHLTEAGYPTSKTDLKNAKRAKFELIEHAIPTDAPGIPELIRAVLAFEPDFEKASLVGSEVRHLTGVPLALVA